MVEAFIIERLDVSSQDRVRQLLDLLEMYGTTLGWPHVKYVRNGLWELRIMAKPQLRILFVVQSRKIVMLHMFKKKANKIPFKEIDTAEKRWRTLLAE